jgi:hypothetical protein
VSPLAVSDNTISSMPLSRRWCFLTICGTKLLLVSRGTSISTGPISVNTVLARVPLRESPIPARPGHAGHSPGARTSLGVQRRFEHVLGQLVEQPVRANQLDPLFFDLREQLLGKLLMIHVDRHGFECFGPGAIAAACAPGAPLMRRLLRHRAAQRPVCEFCRVPCIRLASSTPWNARDGRPRNARPGPGRL